MIGFVPLSDYLAMSIMALLSIFFTMLFFCLALKVQKRLDRYRLKYGFDTEIEMKDTHEPTDTKLERREKNFKRRTFRD